MLHLRVKATGSGVSLNLRPYGNRFSPDWSAIHNLILCQCLILIPSMRPRPDCFPLTDLYLHVLQLYAHQQEVDLAHNRVPHVVLVLVILKLDVQALFYAHLHLHQGATLLVCMLSTLLQLDIQMTATHVGSHTAVATSISQAIPAYLNRLQQT